MEKIYMFKKFRAAREMLTLRLPTTDWASSKPLSWEEEEEEFTFFIVIPLILFSPSSLISLAKYSYLFLSTCRRFFSLLFMCKHEQLHRHMYFFFKLATTIVRDRWNWIWIFNCCYIILFIPTFFNTQLFRSKFGIFGHGLQRGQKWRTSQPDPQFKFKPGNGETQSE